MEQKSPTYSMVSDKMCGAHEAAKQGSLCKRDLHHTAFAQKSPMFSYFIEQVLSCSITHTHTHKRALLCVCV